jgi:WXG100 family type VII secretion target
MPEEIRLVIPTAEDMIKTFVEGVNVLQETNSRMEKIASTLEGGALLGQGGTAFVEAIRDSLNPAIARLEEKYQELAQDVRKAIEDMQEADQESKGKF